MSGSLDFESGEDRVIERDMWADHPARQLDFVPKINSPEEAQAPEEALNSANDLGHSADGKS